MTSTPLVDAVQSFLLADTWEASRAVVEAEPQLLSAEALELVQALAAEAQAAGDERMEQLLKQHHAILEHWLNDPDDRQAALEFELETALAELAETPSSPAELPRRVTICRTILDALDRDDDSELWALVQAALGTALLLSPVGDRIANIEEAVAAYDLALEVLPERSLERARTLNNLGQAMLERYGGEPDENLERAVEAFRKALVSFGPEADREEVGQTHNNLGNALNRRQRGLRDQNREEALVCYREALELLPPGSAAALAHVNLGIALMERIPGAPVDNLDRAIAAFTTALEMLDAGSQPVEWACAQTNLGSALQRRAANTDDAAALEGAIVAFEAAAEVLTDAREFHARALVLGNLGNALLARAAGAPGEDVERAIACYDSALEELSRETTPHDWGQIQNNIGHAYRARGTGDMAENLERAIAAYGNALQVLTPRGAPVEHAQAKKNLASAYLQRRRGDHVENREQALALYRDALAVRESVYGPEHPRVASVLYSIAKVQRLQGDLEGARTSLERALEIDEAHGGTERLGRRYRSLARTARDLRDFEASERALERALDIDEELYGATHPTVLEDLVLLAELRQTLDSGTTTNLVRRAAMVEELGGDVGQRKALDEIAELLRRGGDLLAAERTLERAVAVDETLFGRDHPRVVNSLLKLAEVLRQAGDTAGARSTLERAARIQTSTQGRVATHVAAALATVSELVSPNEASATDIHVSQSGPALLPAATPVVLRFTDEFRGRVQRTGNDTAQPAAGDARMTVSLAVEVPDAERFLSDPQSVAPVSGHVRCAPLGGERRIDRGWCAVFHDPACDDVGRLFYRLCFTDDDGRECTLRGIRRIEDDRDRGDDALSATLSIEVFARPIEDFDDSAEPIARGTLRVRHLDAVRQLSQLCVEGSSASLRVVTLDKFGRLLLGAQWDVHAERVIAEATAGRP